MQCYAITSRRKEQKEEQNSSSVVRVIPEQEISFECKICSAACCSRNRLFRHLQESHGLKNNNGGRATNSGVSNTSNRNSNSGLEDADVKIPDAPDEATNGSSTPTSNSITSTGAGSIHGRASSRKNRVFVFREFLLSTYGESLPFRGSNEGDSANYSNDDVVLDVAGGKGDLSWLLKNVDGIESVVLDPRPDASNDTPHRWVRSVQFLRAHPDEARLRAIPYRPTHQPLAELLPKLEEQQQRKRQNNTTNNDSNHLNNLNNPLHMRILVNQELVDVLRKVRRLKQQQKLYNNDCNNQSNNGDNVNAAADTNDRLADRIWDSFWRSAIRKGEEAQPHLGSKNNKHKELPSSSSSNNYTGNEPGAIMRLNSCSNVSTNRNSLMCADAAWAMDVFLRRTRLVVGFHPDQATEACLDLAAVLEVPFCVVPCCVFPSEFPHRRLLLPPSFKLNGRCKSERQTARPVRTYHEFLQYLQQKVTPVASSREEKEDAASNSKNSKKQQLKSSRLLRTATLPFHNTESAKNIVLYLPSF